VFRFAEWHFYTVANINLIFQIILSKEAGNKAHTSIPSSSIPDARSPAIKRKD
jgi:hypothetical protein